LDWGDQPFGRQTRGIAWDGKRLWVLDNQAKRICAIAKSPGAVQNYAWLGDAIDVTAEPLFAELDTFTRGKLVLHVTNPTGRPVTIHVASEPSKSFVVTPARVERQVPAGGTKVVNLSVRSPSPLPAASCPSFGLSWTLAFADVAGTPRSFERRTTVHVVPKHPCPRCTGPVTVDGKLDDWKALPFECTQPAQIEFDPSMHKGTDDCRWRFGVAYDERYLYIAIEVTDDKSYLRPGKKVWQQDGVELFLMATPEPGRSMHHGWGGQFGDVLPLLVARGQKPGATVVFDRARLPKGTKVACVTTPTGHATEIAVPVAYLDQMQGRAWQEFRLGLAVDDWDNDHKGAQLWWLPDWRRSRHIAGSGTFRRQ